MNYHSIPTAITAIFVFLLGIFILLKNKSNRTNIFFSLICLSTTIWLFFAAVAYNTSSLICGELFMRISYLGIVNIPVTVLHFTIVFLDIRRFKKELLVATYVLSITFSYLTVVTQSILNGSHKYPWGYYPKAGVAHPLFLVFFILIITGCIATWIFYYFSKNTSILKKKQIKYGLFAFLSFTLATLDFIPNYGIAFYPFGYISVTIFLGIIGHTIVKYRLLDISIVITRTGIFIAVYSLVLGIPFALAFGVQDLLKKIIGENWWIIPLVSSTVLATAGPFIYLYIQTQAENRLLQEQRRYQTTLRQASLGMGRIKDLRKLLNLIVHIVTRTVRLDHGMVYIYDNLSKKYLMGASRHKVQNTNVNGVIEAESPLIQHFKKSTDPLVYEEIKQRTQDYQDKELVQLESYLQDLDAALVVPSFIENRLLGVLVLGRKKSGRLYSQDDISVFSILANQAALAIENAQFYEEMKKTHQQLFQAEKMATIGTMADGLSHQINNRLHALGFIAGDALDTIRLKDKSTLSPDVKGLMDDIENSLKRIQENVMQGGEIVQGLMRYTRRGEQGFSDVELDQLIKASLEMAQYKVKLNQFSLIKEYPADLAKIKGNFTQLQEVFFNLIDNAYDAMMQRKTERQEEDYQPTLRIAAKRENGFLQIIFTDNGIGVKPEDREKLFTPFFTTKLSSKKGTGLGLYVIQKIIEENHAGKVTFGSEYMKGTEFLIQLPAAT